MRTINNKKNMITYCDNRIEIFGGVEMLMKKKVNDI